MAKIWRVVIIIAAFLAAAGVVLIGAAWLTGASPVRIVELVFDGPEGLQRWWDTATRSGASLWESFRTAVLNLF